MAQGVRPAGGGSPCPPLGAGIRTCHTVSRLGQWGRALRPRGDRPTSWVTWEEHGRAGAADRTGKPGDQGSVGAARAREAMAAGCALLSGVMNTQVGCGGGCMPEVIELHPFRG